MKSLVTMILAVCLSPAIILAGCDGRAAPPRMVAADDGHELEAPERTQEFCYRGVVYVVFYPGANSSWGGVRLDRDTGNVIQCGLKK